MKKERKGCLFGLIMFVGRVILSLVLAFLSLCLIYSWSYQHVKPFKNLVETQHLPTSVSQLLGKKEIKLPTVQLPRLFQNNNSADGQVKDVLPFKNHLQLKLGNLDVLGRATFAHIQLKESDEPKAKRAPRLKYNPPGWHNYFLETKPDKKSWAMNRGHLVGYQFSGLNDEPKNLVCETAWFNQGDYDKMDDSNPQSMLYYENRLDHWLAQNPNAYLDYKVTPIYTGSELLPRKIKLDYVGLTQNKESLLIKLGSQNEKAVNGKTEVILDNTAPNLKVNYKLGTVMLK